MLGSHANACAVGFWEQEFCFFVATEASYYL